MKVKSHYFGARLLKPTTDSRAALMLSPMTTTTVTGSASRGTGCCVCARPRRADRRHLLSLAARVPRIAVPAGERDGAAGNRGHVLQGRGQAGARPPCRQLDRPSETYLYVFIVAYLVIYARRIRELEAVEGAPK